jgi:methionyl-tRNA formyltransferase
MEKLRIVFMGTPDFAVGILNEIYEKNFDIAAVITAPDKPAGRGQKLQESAVKVYATTKNIPVLQPTNLKDVSFLEELKSYNANLHIVVAFRMLPEVVWKMPKLGTFNLHASLLPQYRGAAPINWAIINGESKTGVTTFFIDDKIDTGAIILSEATSIESNENVGDLHDKLMLLGGKVVIETLNLIQNGTVSTTIQIENAELKTAYKLNKDNCKINWHASGVNIYNQIRGLSPYPTAWTYFSTEGEKLAVKIYDVTFVQEEHSIAIGTTITSKKELMIAVPDGFIQINTLQYPGKKKMQIHELLNGVKIALNTVVE